mmetsp:Transcript_32075/g.95785  ORF Transcript_32075/g.95785 Transcript_32075/m.95785 type:complete len:218 (+) Transcript_32075:1116-1769(+)
MAVAWRVARPRISAVATSIAAAATAVHATGGQARIYICTRQRVSAAAAAAAANCVVADLQLLHLLLPPPQLLEQQKPMQPALVVDLGTHHLVVDDRLLPAEHLLEGGLKPLQLGHIDDGLPFVKHADHKRAAVLERPHRGRRDLTAVGHQQLQHVAQQPAAVKPRELKHGGCGGGNCRRLRVDREQTLDERDLARVEHLAARALGHVELVNEPAAIR